MQRGHDASHARRAKWDQYATPDDRRRLTDTVGEGHLQRDWQGDVAEFRHEYFLAMRIDTSSLQDELRRLFRLVWRAIKRQSDARCVEDRRLREC